MYTFSEDGGYSFITTTTETYQQSSQTFQRTTTTTELQWEMTPNGYAPVQASDLLFKDDVAPVKTLPHPCEEETEYQKCQTWYVPSTPVEKPSRSQEYLAPHKRYAGYDKTHNQQGRSNIRGHTISSSGESSHYAQSRSQSRQPQYRSVPHHQRSMSRSTYNANPAPAVSRERAQQRPQLMQVRNLTKRTTRRSTRNHVHSQRQIAPPAPVEPTCTEVRKVRGKWIKGYVAPKPKICFQFLNHGTCSYGDRCRFEHVAKKVNRRTRRQQPARTQRTTATTTTFVGRNRFNFDDSKEAW